MTAPTNPLVKSSLSSSPYLTLHHTEKLRDRRLQCIDEFGSNSHVYLRLMYCYELNVQHKLHIVSLPAQSPAHCVSAACAPSEELRLQHLSSVFVLNRIPPLAAAPLRYSCRIYKVHGRILLYTRTRRAIHPCDRDMKEKSSRGGDGTHLCQDLFRAGRLGSGPKVTPPQHVRTKQSQSFSLFESNHNVPYVESNVW